MVVSRPGMIYHYCSTETFFKIVTSKTLWMTHSAMANDYLERRWVSELVEEYLKQQSDEDFFTRLRWQYRSLGNAMFMTCFSADGDLLSQWRAYSENAAGVAVGFHKEDFAQGIYDSVSSSPQLYQINYEHRVNLKEALHKRKSLIDLEGKELMEKAKNLAAQFLSMEMTHKNPAFAEEKEFRLIYTPEISTWMDIGTGEQQLRVKGEFTNIKYRYTSQTIMPYFEFPISPEKTPIQHIVLGPRNQTPDAGFIEAFLVTNGFRKIMVEYSSASYR